MATLSVSDRIIRPLTECFSPEVARRVVSVKLDPTTQARIDELAAKANSGTISEDEGLEYAEFIEYVDILGIIKAQARLLLKREEVV